MSTILACSNVTKSYGKNDAVRNLEMKLHEHTICGLLGRNGAGKTTLLNMITGSIFPSNGQIEIAGSRLKKGETPQDVCYVREKNLFFGSAKVMEILQLASVFHKNWDWPFAHKLLTTFNLNPNEKIRQLSRGMESLVGNVIGLASRASLTIYDEPVLGLDVLMRERFYRILVEDYAEYPRTILLSTHLIDEIAMVVEKVYIMDSGSILLHDEVDNIRDHSHLLMGDRESVDRFANGKQVIYQEPYGKGVLAALYGALGDADKQQAHKLGITIEGLPLQKFFSYLIEGGQRIE
ncbi:ABC transporter ATP-binding protein [Paenibacillus sp. WQ 127069]|jgi:ABC-2 type transport system ATP-binding protein|uniref:ABC transporter ATP-binding protein n=1 Tax=Paenibacillus baimaensis TaxID=2982185 RepID=A0ABT2UD31_9BACL|nr:ABC transporter ATP-binding protein [Paenibacillus sp. WQ 127069]MCU6792505.1 ABC transporter ATP-binding protein [Paenibacillus sp. WQ 127069]